MTPAGGIISRTVAKPCLWHKGVRREAESEGSRRQNAALTNRKHIEADTLDKKANHFKVRYLHGKRGRKCARDKREGECALPGEICCSAKSYHRCKTVGRSNRSQQRA